MQVILLEKVAALGNMGATVNVKPGFARNFLIPKGKALPATEANVQKFETLKAELALKTNAAKEAAQATAATLEGKGVKIERQTSETGQLYGSVKARDVAEAIKTQLGTSVPRSLVVIGEPIKTVGEFTVTIALHADVQVKMPVEVARNTNA